MSRFQRSIVEAIPLGMKTANDWQANERANEQLKMQQAAEARNAAEYERKLGIENKVTALQDQLLSPNKGNYGLNGPSKFAAPEISSAMPMAEQADIAAGLKVGGIGLTDGMNLGGEGMRARAPAAPAAGMQPTQQLGLAPPAKEQVLSNRQAPSRGEAQRILAQIAVLRGDTSGYATHSQSASDMDFEDGFNQHMKGFTGAKEQVAPLVGYINQNTRATLGAPDKQGFRMLSVANENGEATFERLSRQDQAKLYAAHMLMDTNPAKAMQIMQGVNKDLAAALQADTNLYKGVADNNNDVAGKRHTVDYHNQSLGLRRQEMAASADYRKELLGQKAKQEGDPALLKQLNDLGAQINNETDPAKIRELTHRYNVTSALYSTSLNKPVQVRGPSGGAGDKHTKIEQGTFRTPDGVVYSNDEFGNPVAVLGGVTTSSRTSELIKSGVPSDIAPSLQWNNYGTGVKYDGLEYRAGDPKDMALLAQKIRADQLHNRRGEEAALRGKGILDPRDALAAAPPKIAQGAGVAPSNYPALGNGVVETRRGPVEPTSVDVPPHLRYLNGENPFGLTLPTISSDPIRDLFSSSRDPRYNTIGAVR